MLENKHRLVWNGAVRIFFALVLATGLLPAVAWANDPAGPQSPSAVQSHASSELAAPGTLADLQADTLEEALETTDFVQGQSIVMVNRAIGDNAAGVLDEVSELLEAAEVLNSISVGQYQRAAGERLDASLAASWANGAEDAELVDILLVESESYSTHDLIALLLADPRIISAELNATANVGAEDDDGIPGTYAAVVGNDIPGYDDTKDLTGYQFNLSDAKTYVTSRTVDANRATLNLPGWNDPSVVNSDGYVAVIDTGIDITHPDLQSVLADNMTDYSTRGGSYGYNAIANADPENVLDDHSHGTHCAGIIGAAWNGFGTSGVVNGAKIVTVKVSDASGMISIAALLRGFDYLEECVDNGLDLRVMSLSLGSGLLTMAENAAVTRLGEKGVVAVYAAGNNSLDTCVTPGTAQGLQQNPYAIVVGSADRYGALAPYSNFGYAAVDVLAVGSDVLSTVPGDKAKYTSFADTNPRFIDFAEEGVDKGLVFCTPATVWAALNGFPVPAEGFLTPSMSSATLDEGTSSYRFDMDALNDACASTLQAVKAYPGITEKQLEQLGDMKAVGVCVLIPCSETPELSGFSHCGYLPSKSDPLFPGSPALNTLISRVLAWPAEDKAPEAARWKAEQNLDFMVEMFADRSSWITTAFQTANLFIDDEKAEPATITLPSGSGATSYCALMIADVLPVLTGEDSLFIDAAALSGEAGRSSAQAYDFMSGTSMACPGVAGSASVVYESMLQAGDSDDFASDGERARRVAMRLKASVNPAITGNANVSEPELICSQAGYVDLSVDGKAAPYTPVMDSVEVCSASGGAALTIYGGYFGTEQGTVTIDKAAASVVSWNNESVTVALPANIASGEHAIKLASAESRSAMNRFVFSVSDNPASVPLYEKEIALPDGKAFPVNTMMAAMTGFDGRIFFLTISADESELYKDLWAYDPAVEGADAFSLQATLPDDGVNSASFCAWDGKLLISGFASDGEEPLPLKRHLYSFDPAARQITELDADFLPTDSTLVNADGTLLAVGKGHLSSETSSWEPVTAGAIARVDLDAKTAESVGDLGFARVTPDAVADRDGAIYLWNGMTYDDEGFAPLIEQVLERLVPQADGTYSCERIEMPTLPDLGSRAGGYAVTVTADGPVLVCAQAEGVDADTFILDCAAGSHTAYGKRASYSQLYYPVAAAYEGWLYVLGSSAQELERGGWVMRATAMETIPLAGDTAHAKPAVDPDAGDLPFTGDPLACATWAPVLVMCVSGVAVLLALRRKAGALERTVKN